MGGTRCPHGERSASSGPTTVTNTTRCPHSGHRLSSLSIDLLCASVCAVTIRGGRFDEVVSFLNERLDGRRKILFFADDTNGEWGRIGPVTLTTEHDRLFVATVADNDVLVAIVFERGLDLRSGEMPDVVRAVTREPAHDRALERLIVLAGERRIVIVVEQERTRELCRPASPIPPLESRRTVPDDVETSVGIEVAMLREIQDDRAAVDAQPRVLRFLRLVLALLRPSR
ncbi:hypothetical protein J2754_003036 [Halarchaeum solikamskense]|nr:hypothetical protein [Halarchaeum solikamskense]